MDEIKDKEKKNEEEMVKQARLKALETLELEKERKKRKEEEEKEKERKKLSINEKCTKREKTYNIRFNYKCSSVCGNEYIVFNTVKDEYPFIDEGDFIIYKNVSHVNHNRNAIVIDYVLQGTGSKDAEKDKKYPVFDIYFTDKIEDLPFYKIEVGGVLVNTKQKIVVIKKVNYDSLKLTYSMKNSDKICIRKIDSNKSKEYKIDDNISLNSGYEKKGNKINAKFQFNKFIRETFKENIPNEIEDINKKNSISIDSKKGKKKQKTIKINQSEIKKHLKKINDELIKIEKQINTNSTVVKNKSVDENVKILNAIFNYFNNLQDNNKKLYIYIYIFFNMRNERKIIMSTMKKRKEEKVEDSEESNQNEQHTKTFYDIFEKLNGKFDEVKTFFLNKYKSLYELKDSDDEKYIEKNIIKIVNKNRADINSGNTSEYREYKLKDYIVDEVKLLTKKYFTINKEFTPEKVFLRYADKELLEMDEKEKEDFDKEEEERSKQFFKTSDANSKLVKPTSDKIFTITHINDIFLEEEENTDEFFSKNIIKCDEKNKMIDVYIDIGLSIKDRKTQETIFEDKKKLTTTFIDTIAELSRSIRDNTKCETAKKNWNDDVNQIKIKINSK